MKFFTLIVILISPIVFVAQDENKGDTKELFSKFYKDIDKLILKEEWKGLPENDYLQFLDWLEDSLAYKTRIEEFRIYSAILCLGYASEASSVRKKAIQQLLSIYTDAHRANVRFYTEKLLLFRPKDFDDIDIIEKLLTVLRNEEIVTHHHILLCGALNLKGTKEILKDKYIDKNKRFKGEFSVNYFRGLEWASRLALARLGEKEEVEFVLDTLQTLNKSTVATYYLDDIAYMANREAMSTLRLFLSSEETLENEGLFIAKLAGRIIVKCIEYPPAKKQGIYSDESVLLLRAWMQENQDIVFKPDFISIR